MNTVEDNVKDTQKLWQDYFFLTKEMIKFLEGKDLDLFFELMKQREHLQEMIESAVGDTYASSPEGQMFLRSLQQEDQRMVLTLQFTYNNARNQRNAANAYDNLVPSFIGNHLNWQK